MKRGEFYRVYRGTKNDPKDYRVFLIVSRQEVLDSPFSTVVCAPVYSKYNGISTQIEVGAEEGLKHDSAVYCDDLVGIQKSMLTNYIGVISDVKMRNVNIALRIALATG